MNPVCVDESIGNEGPYIRASPRQRSVKHKCCVIAHRNESEAQQKFDILLLGEQQRARRVNYSQHGQHGDDNGRNVENWFALHEEIRRVGALQLRSFASQRKMERGKEKGRAFALPRAALRG